MPGEGAVASSLAASKATVSYLLAPFDLLHMRMLYLGFCFSACDGVYYHLKTKCGVF